VEAQVDIETPDKSGFEILKDRVVDRIKTHFPFRGSKHTLFLDNIRIDDNLSGSDVVSQLQAKHNDDTWGVPIRGDMRLVDNKTGALLSKQTVQLAKLPKLTNRYSYIVNGDEYQVDHLLRLKSGVYTRVASNGDMRSEFNLRHGGDRNFSIELDRIGKKLNFKTKKKESKIPAYPLLKVLGISDDALEKAWGKEVFAANKIEDPSKFEQTLVKFWRNTDKDAASKEPPSLEKLKEYTYSHFDNTELYPDVTKITLGHPYSKADGKALLAASSKLLAVSRGEEKQDDRDSLVFKEVAHVEDFIPTYLDKKRPWIHGKIRQSIDSDKKNISQILQGGDIFKGPIIDFFMKGGNVSERGEQTNPLQMLSSHFKTTTVAPDFGGIKNVENLRDEMRAINPSQFGFLDPMHTPESERTGITLHLGTAVRKRDNDLTSPAYDLKTNKTKYLNVPNFHTSTIVLPDQVTWKKGKPHPIADHVKAKLPGGDIETIPFSKADYVMPSAKGMFSYTSNSIPFLANDQGTRASMADKQIEQAIALTHREVPLVQSAASSKNPDNTYEKWVGGFSSIKSPIAGKITKITPDHIHIQSGRKEQQIALYNNFPLNDPKSMMHSEPTVKVGDTVKKGQLLADSNFTKDGRLALGTNLLIGYIPYKGYNFEDGVVISETAAKKLTSQHLHGLSLELDSDDKRHPAEWMAHASSKAKNMTPQQVQLLDKDGVIREGSVIKPGQVLVTALAPNTEEQDPNTIAAYKTRGARLWKDKSLVWDDDHTGVVTKVVKSKSGKLVKVYVRTEEQAVVGDKVSGRHANKGIITKILPDSEMPFIKDPHTQEQKPLEVLLNPSGVPTRMNVGTVLETAASKIAKKTGKPYIIDNFAVGQPDNRSKVLSELKTHGLSDEELVYDPKRPDRPLGSVLVGPQYTLKLKHQVEKKLTVRGGGTDLDNRSYKYDLDNQPEHGGAHGGQGVGALELYALLGHNARHNIREMSTYKSDKQSEDFWTKIMQGVEPPPPSIPFSYHKFGHLIRGLGVNMEKEGTRVRLTPMTNSEVLRLAGDGKNEIKDGSKAIKAKGLSRTIEKLIPEKDGIFDLNATGGIGGTKWSYIRIAEPMPNPIFVGSKQNKGPIPTFLNLKVDQIDSIVSGKSTLHGKTGGPAIADALRQINVDKEIAATQEELSTKRGDALDRANRKIKMLKALKEAKLTPVEAYMLDYLPVVPPIVRPIALGKKTLVNTGLNDLYKNFAIINDKLGKYNPIFPEEIRQDLRRDLWNGFKALQGVGRFDPIYDKDSYNKRKELKGILTTIGPSKGEQPKEGFFQSALIRRRQDLSIRSTIVPEPALGLDQVGLPKAAAMELYKPFVVAKMKSQFGYEMPDALKAMQKMEPHAIKALEATMKERPLILKRDPVLHKFGVMAFTPVLYEGKAIRIHPLVTGGFNADFDGDTMAGSVPISAQAVEEAKKMFPSKNLFSSTNFDPMYRPGQESLLGLYLLSKWGKPTDVRVKDYEALRHLVEVGKVGHTDIVKVDSAGAKPTTFGRMWMAKELPSKLSLRDKLLHDPAFELSSKPLKEFVNVLAKEHSDTFDKSINHLKDLGNDYSYKSGFSFGLKDFATLKERDSILSLAHKKAKAALHIKDKNKREDAVISAYNKATEDIEAAAKAQYVKGGNRLFTMVYSGARGKPEQLRQMIAAPMLMQDHAGRTIPTPVTHSYAEGLDIGDYWLAQHGARKGILQRNRGSSKPGELTKDIINSSIATLIVSEDCGTKHGIALPIKNHKDTELKDVADRYLAHDIKLQDGSILKGGTLLTPTHIDKIRLVSGTVPVRSPLKCEHPQGICAKCYGLNESGKLHPSGTNIGTIAGQSLGEPATQLALDAFHTGGLASGRGGSSISRIERLQQLLKMPDKLKGQATLSKVTGKITSIRPNKAIGGHDVVIEGHTHRVDELNPELKIGTTVERGGSLSQPWAPVNPQQYLSVTKDINKVRKLLTDELHGGLYQKEGVRQRNIETVVRALTNLTRVKDPGSSHWDVWDVVPHSAVEAYNRSIHGTVHKPVTHEPVLLGSEQIPHKAQDWMSRLNYRHIKSTIQQAASTRLESDLHGMNPIPGIAHGAEFGKPPKGKKQYLY
jgi:DNA-directed RNA polymerase subunit beta'